MTTWQGSEKRAQSQYIDIDDEEGEEEGIPNNHIPYVNICLHGKMLLSHSWDFQHLMTNELSESESVTRRIIGNLQEDKQLTICY